ncbi:MAG: hypothetical protein KGY99_01955 [Phycisphaerae bacterium]|nr:hypothetical protein [Phycisphaerae bacterium]
MTRMLHGQAESTVPEPIVQTLKGVIWRTRRVIALRGLAATVATALLSLLVIMAIDRWVVIFASWPRWLLLFSALGATAVAAFWFLIHPLARSFTLSGIARAVEQRHPELQERLSSAVELLSSTDAPELRGSEALIRALVGEAELGVRAVRPNREVTLRAAMPFLILAGGVIAVLVGLTIAWPRDTLRQLARAAGPWMNLAHVSGDDIRVTVTGDAARTLDGDGTRHALLSGRRLGIRAAVDNTAVRSAEVHFARDPDGDRTTVAMTPAGGDAGTRRFTYAGVPFDRGTYRFAIRAGDAGTAWHRVTVVEPPAVAETAVQFTYPAYMHRSPETIVAPPGAALETWADTHVTVIARANKPLRSVAATLNDSPLDIRPGGGTTYRFARHLAGATDRRWRLRLTDAYGFSADVPATVLRVRVDEPPTIGLSPAHADLVDRADDRTLRVRPGDAVPFVHRASDDVALRRVRLTVSPADRDEPIVPRAWRFAPGDRTRRHAGRYVLDLAAPALRDASRVTVAVHAADGKTADPATGREANPETTERYTVLVDRGIEASYAARIADSEELRLRKVLREILKLLKDAREDSKTLFERLPKARASAAELPDDVTRRVDAVAGTLADARAKTLGAAGLPMVSGTYPVIARRLRAIARDHVGRAEALSRQILLTDGSDARLGLARDADFKINKAIEELTDILEQLHALVATVAEARRLEDLDTRQAWLAEALEQIGSAGEPRHALSHDDWQRMQHALARDLGAMVRRRPEALQTTLTERTDAARDLAAEAAALQKRQEALAKQTERLEDIRRREDAAGEQHDLADERRDLLDEQRAKLLEAQRQLANSVLEVADQLARAAPQPDRMPLQAARAADEAAAALAGNQRRRAAAAAQRAAEALGQLAGQSSGSAASEPPRRLPRDMQAETAALHQRQQALAEQLNALAGANPAAAAAAQQQDVAARAAELADAAALIRDQAEALGLTGATQRLANQAAAHAAQARQSAGAAAQQAVSESGQAGRSPGQAGEQAGAQQGAPGAGQPTSGLQRRAAEQMGRTAQALSELGQALAEADPASESPPPALVDAGELAESFERASTAGETALPSDAAAAAAMLSQLAASASQSAQAMGLAPGSLRRSPMHPPPGGQGTGVGRQRVDHRLHEALDEAAATDEHWARVHGRLGGDVRQRSVGRGARRYRDLNRAYFEAIADERSTDSSED